MTSTAATTTTTTLVVGDDVLYRGSITEFHNLTFCVIGRAPVALVHAAAFAQGVSADAFPEAYRYAIQRGETVLRMVRRGSLDLLEEVSA